MTQALWKGRRPGSYEAGALPGRRCVGLSGRENHPRTKTRYTAPEGDAMTILDWVRVAIAGLLLGGGAVALLAYWIETATRELDDDQD